MTNQNSQILAVRDLKVSFRTDDGIQSAVDGVSFELNKGETLGIVGESGSGKSATALSIMGLIATGVEGEILFNGLDINKMSPGEVRKIRGSRAAMIFQDPTASLNPFLRVSSQLTEVTRLHLGHSRREAREHALEMLRTVAIPDAEARIDDHPHEFSGGLLQRVVIAMALSCGPELLIADEPTTALDVTIQAQILDLIKELKLRLGTSVIIITHDLGVIAGMTDNVIVIYAGRVFERAATQDLFARPANPYTIGLLKSIPDISGGTDEDLYQIPGMPPDSGDRPVGCPFAERCFRAEDVCRLEFPPMIEVAENHQSLCHFAEEVYAGAAIL